MSRKKKEVKKDETKPRQKTHTVIVLDKSGSMSGTRHQTVTGVNEQIQTAKKNAKDQDIFVSLVTFDDDVWEHFWEVPAAKLEEMPASAYNPSGSTALWDGAYYAVDKLRKTTQADDNTAYFVIIITDGQENASKHCGRNSYEAERTFSSLQKELESTGNWTFQLIGCDRAYVEQVAQRVGLHVSNCAVWSNQDEHLARRATKKMARASSNYYDARAKGLVMKSCTTSPLEFCMADYTSDKDDAVVDSQVPPVVNTQMPSVVTPQMPSAVLPPSGPDMHDLQSLLNRARHSPRTRQVTGGMYGTPQQVCPTPQDMMQPQTWVCNTTNACTGYGSANKVAWTS